MSEPLAALIGQMEAAARTAWQEEEATRTRLAQEVARLERRRAFAYRRMNFVRALATAAKTKDSEADVIAAQRAAARHELDWFDNSEFQRTVLDRMQPVGLAVWRCLRGQDAEVTAIQAELDAFEGWFEATYREPFYAQFDREPPQVSLVET